MHAGCLHEISALFAVTSTGIIHASANIGVIDAGIHLALCHTRSVVLKGIMNNTDLLSQM